MFKWEMRAVGDAVLIIDDKGAERLDLKIALTVCRRVKHAFSVNNSLSLAVIRAISAGRMSSLLSSNKLFEQMKTKEKQLSFFEELVSNYRR